MAPTLRSKLKLSALAGLAVAIITSIPQIIVWVDSGREWQGSYACVDPDELAYSAYLNSLIHGKPRLNNSYLGNQDKTPLRDNLYSIQFLPPYALALVARTFGLSASTAFILLTPLAAFASSLAIFWLIHSLTGHERLAALGTMIILLCGVLVSESPLVLQNHYAGFPFLRRYIPAFGFPLFFLYCACVWRAFARGVRRPLIWSVAAAVIFGSLVFSYFYLWTAAVAWLFCLTAIWFVLRATDRAHVLKCFVTFGAVAVFALVPYFYLLSHRTDTLDTTQALVLTHAPDPFRLTEVIGLLILVALAWGARRGKVEWSSPVVIFVAGCATTPFIVFNQQIITGRSLQSFHYEQFVVNYLTLVGLVVTYKLVWWHFRIRPRWWIALAVIIGVTTALQISFVGLERNRIREQAMPVFDRIEERSNRELAQGFVLFDESLLSASAPTSGTFAVLWSPYLYTFGNTSKAENIERFYQCLYYMGVDPKRFETMLKERPVARAAVFGLTRVNNKLSSTFNPVTSEEISEAVKSYSAYINSFSPEQASRWPLSYVVLVDDSYYDLANLNRWYELDGSERVGRSIIYGLRLRTGKSQSSRQNRREYERESTQAGYFKHRGDTAL